VAARFLLPLTLILILQMSTAQETTLRTQSNLVLVPALVKDTRGHAVYGLAANDFVIEDDGVAQSLQLDEAAEAESVSLVILVQCGRKSYREFARMKGLSSMLSPLFDQGQTSPP